MAPKIRRDEEIFPPENLADFVQYLGLFLYRESDSPAAPSLQVFNGRKAGNSRKYGCEPYWRKNSEKSAQSIKDRNKVSSMKEETQVGSWKGAQR